MENSVKCPVCHTEVRSTDYFCFNCGKNLKPKPPSTSNTEQLIVYLKSIFLAPYGIILGIRYLRQEESKSKIVGVTAIILTLITILIITKLASDLMSNINDQVNIQRQQFGDF